MVNPVGVTPGVFLWSGYFDRNQQESLLEEVLCRVEQAPFYRPAMPRTGKSFSVEQTNFGSLGWISDTKGYRYLNHHPQTQRPWPEIPEGLVGLWRAIANYPAPPQCCLVNLYRAGAKMGLHQDRDEVARDAPVVSVSLGDDAVFCISTSSDRKNTRRVNLASGDVMMFGGPARMAFHGVDRTLQGSSTLLAEGGRLNLTLRRVSLPT